MNNCYMSCYSGMGTVADTRSPTDLVVWPLACSVFYLQYVACPQPTHCSIPDSDFHLAGEDEYILTPGSSVPIAEGAVGKTTEGHIGLSLEGYSLRLSRGSVQVFEVSLAVATGVESNNH